MKDEILKIIAESHWTIIKDQENIKMIQVQNGASKINIYYGKMTVVTILQGATQYFYDVKFAELKEILGIKKNFFQKIFTFFH